MENMTTHHSENDNLIYMPRSLQVEETREIIEIQNYESIDNTVETNTLKFFKTLSVSVWTSFTTNLAAIPLALLMISVLYFDMNTSNICFEQIQRNNTLSRSVMKWVLAGHVVEVITLHFWFQLALMLIFTWREFMSRHRNALLIALFQGCIVSVYKIVLFTQHVNFTLDRYRYTGNVVFLFGVIYTGYVVSKKICACCPTDGLKKFQVFKIITTQYFLGCIIALVYRYLTIPWFISEENETIKAIIAVIVHLPVITVNIINEKVALSSSQFVRAGRNFVFISFVTGVSTLVFRIMQADVKNINIFIALSVYRGIVQILLRASEKLRKRILSVLCKYFKRYRCCRQRLRRQNEENGDAVRLDVDKYIQLMLYQHSALIVSQAYQALYTLNNFDTKPWDVFAEPLIRIAIGSAINLVSNSVSIFIYMYWYNSRLPTVWSQAWRLHITTVALGSVMAIVYFTVVLLTVFQSPEQDLVVRNCTVPF